MKFGHDWSALPLRHVDLGGGAAGRVGHCHIAAARRPQTDRGQRVKQMDSAGVTVVWLRLSLVSLATVEILDTLLNRDEHARAARFVFPVHRQRFVVARGMLRRWLGAQIGRDPAALRFVYNAYGKPALADDPDLHFNLSHAGDWIVYAFARQRRVGVDVEVMRDDVEIKSLARHVFSPAEQAIFYSLPAAQQREAFFNGWTRKEAYVKAQGMGMSLPLDSFDVSLRPGISAAIVETRPQAAEAERWSICTLERGALYKAALVIEGQGWQLRQLEATEWC